MGTKRAQTAREPPKHLTSTQPPNSLGPLPNGCPFWAQVAAVTTFLCQGPQFGRTHHMLLQSFVAPDQPQEVSPSIAAARMQSLVEAMAVCQEAVGHGNRKEREGAFSKFTKWLNEMGVSLAEAEPAHVIAYLQDYSKRGTFMTPEGPRCAPDTLKNHLGFLRKGMALYRKRQGLHDPDTHKGACLSRCRLSGLLGRIVL